MAAKIGVHKRRSLLVRITARDGEGCYWCGVETLPGKRRGHRGRDTTLDHLVPKSRGGTNAFENLVISCRKCNEARGNMIYKPTGTATMTAQVVAPRRCQPETN